MKRWNIIQTQDSNTLIQELLNKINEKVKQWKDRKVWMVNREVNALEYPQEPRRCIPIHLIASVCAHLCGCSVLCQNNVRYTQLHWQQHYRDLLQSTTRKQERLCVHVCLCELQGQGECFLADLITIEPLANPTLPLSTYNMAAYPLARLQTESNLL